MIIENLIVFDFDGTMVNTMLPDPGKRIWLEKKGEPWSYRGWWGRSESLCLDTFEHPVNDWVLEQYNKACEMENTYKIILTGRMDYLKDDVQKILNYHGINDIDKIYCNRGGRTESFKIKVLATLLNRHQDTLNKIVMYDDREEHYPTFKHWGVETQKRTGIKIVMDKITNGIGFYQL